MRGKYIGEFEEIVLLMVVILGEESYMMTIREELKSQLNRKVSMGAMHTTLSRLEKKGMLKSELGGASAVRGGRRKRIYTITSAGKKVLNEIREIRAGLWNQVPSLILKPNA